MASSRHLKLSLVCILSNFAPSSMALATALDAASSLNLLANRQNSECPDPSLTKCPTGIDFCCTQGTTCMPTTDDKTSIICCPIDADCRYIQSIACDIETLNATSHPLQPVHSSRLDQQLPTCGDGCCPFGYQCQGGSCYLFDSKSASTTGSAPDTSGTPPVIVPLPDPSVPAAAEQNTQTPVPSSDGSSFPAKAVLLGVFVGLLGAIAVIGLALFCLKRRKRKQQAQAQESPEFMGSTPKESGHQYNYSGSQHTISEPAWAPEFGGSHRTDFLLRRGETETSYEQSAKPAWSLAGDSADNKLAQPSRTHSGRTKASTPERGRAGGSFRSRLTEGTTLNDPETPASQMAAGKDRMPPLFARPLKFGQQLTPAKSLRATGKRPARPARGDEIPMSKKFGSSQRDGSQHRPLMLRDLDESRPNSLSRANSNASIDSLPPPQKPPQHASEEIVTFLMPPPALSDHAKAHESSMTNITRFSDLMKQMDYTQSDSGSWTPKR